MELTMSITFLLNVSISSSESTDVGSGVRLFVLMLWYGGMYETEGIRGRGIIDGGIVGGSHVGGGIIRSGLPIGGLIRYEIGSDAFIGNGVIPPLPLIPLPR